MLLSEFDFSPSAIINPDMIFSKMDGFPETVVSVFSHELFSCLSSLLDAAPITKTHDVDGHWPIYRISYSGKEVAFCKARLGAPACVGLFEDVIALGAKRIILLGNCGVLDRSICDCGIILPTQAIRDEGTSYHYAPAEDLIPVNLRHLPLFRKILDAAGYSYTEGITWTTDGFYRETGAKLEARKKMGAICVEMECAAMQAMCSFRGVEFFQYLYAGDNLDHSDWQPRSLSGTARLDDKQKLALLAFELAAAID